MAVVWFVRKFMEVPRLEIGITKDIERLLCTEKGSWLAKELWKATPQRRQLFYIFLAQKIYSRVGNIQALTEEGKQKILKMYYELDSVFKFCMKSSNKDQEFKFWSNLNEVTYRRLIPDIVLILKDLDNYKLNIVKTNETDMIFCFANLALQESIEKNNEEEVSKIAQYCKYELQMLSKKR